MPSSEVMEPRTGTPAEAIVSTRALLEEVLGVEVGVFSRDAAEPGATCRRLCISGDGPNRLAGACVLIRLAASDAAVAGSGVPRICERGFAVSVHDGEVSNRRVVLLERASAGRGEGLSIERLRAAAGLVERSERLADENRGLIAEVLSGYEQLNVIFEVTQQFGRARDAAEVKHFLVRRLAESLNCDWGVCLSEADGVLWWSNEQDIDRDRCVAEIRGRHADAVEEVFGQQSIVARNADSASGPHGSRLLFCPLGASDERTDLVVFSRGGDRPDFTSGEIRMVDSVLQHGQQVIFNLRLNDRLRTMAYGAVQALVSAIEKKDDYTSGHSERVGLLSRLIGEEMKLPPEQLQDLEWAGLLHDVGKIGIPDGVLTKPGSLTPEEFAQIKGHARMSYDIVAPIEAFATVRDVVLYHHEVPDGTGYPEGLRGDQIPLLARIVHVADTFDALTSTRSYRQAFPIARALEIMRREKHTKLDAQVVDAFERALQRYQAAHPDAFHATFQHALEEATP